MKGTPAAPADTRMMGIVHDGLRRDLARSIKALAADPASRPAGDRRAAIGEQVGWMMDFLHAHHRGEDAWLWPLVRARVPRAGPLLDHMEADHAVVDPLIDACDGAAGRYRDSSCDDARRDLQVALVQLCDALLPHLRREEDEAMPLVSVALTEAEWHAIDQEHFVKPKPLTQLAREGHWLLDGLDAERREVLVRQVPLIPRFVLLHGFARRYRRRAIACWGPQAGTLGRKAYGPAPRLPRSIPRSGRAEVVIQAAPDAVWRVVSDVIRIGEWSHECRHGEWLDEATKAAPGVRFRGTNQAGPWRWSRTNKIVLADAPHTIAWRTIPTLRHRDSTEWQIALQAVDDRTRIVQTYRVLWASPMFTRLYAILVPSHRGRSSELTDDLCRLGELATADTRAADTTARTATNKTGCYDKQLATSPQQRRGLGQARRAQNRRRAPAGNGEGGPMAYLKHRLTRIGNRIGVWMYRTLNGRLSSGSKHVHVLVITTPGRRTRIPRSTCVRYLDSAAGYVVWGTGSGSRRDPDWFRNLRAATEADVQIRSRHLRVRPRELVGADRDATWNDTVLAQAPEVEKYARRSGRTIPVAVLEPLEARPS
jgi:deazaflavin-dependent oxidoreductase (nitroreductase family)